jgi:hypothetical protein
MTILTRAAKGSELTYTELDANLVDTRDALAASSGSSLSGYLPAGTGGVATTVQGKLRELVSVKDFGAVGDGVTDDTAAINAALIFAASTTYKRNVFIPSGSYLTTAPLIIPNYVSLIGDNRGWMTDTFIYGGGVVIFKNHNGNCLSSTGTATNQSIGGTIKNICVVSNAVTYPTGSGVYIDGVHQTTLEGITVSRCGGDSFVLGSTNTANYTTYVTLNNCYANTAGTSKCFAVNSKWPRLNQCISDGGSYGLYIGAQTQEGLVTDFHCESVTTMGIYNSGGRNRFTKGYIALSASATHGVNHVNASGVYFNCLDGYHILGTNAVGQIGILNAGSNNVHNTVINKTVLESLETGYSDLGVNNIVENTLIYNSKYPFVMGGDYSTLDKNVTQNTVAAGGTWSINHTAGTHGTWINNNLDGSNANGLINPGVTGTIGNFSGIKARNNAGFISRNQGQTGAIATGSTISHGLAGAITGGGFYVTCYSSGVTSSPQVSSLTATTITLSWAGTSPAQWAWTANLLCDF